MFKLKKLKFLSFYGLIFSASSNSIAQTNELGFHISPAILAPAQFNRDTSIVNARSSIATSAGINFTRFFKSGLGIRAGFNFGYMSSKFALSTSYTQTLDNPIYPSTLLYNSLTAEPVFRFKINQFKLETFTGAELRRFYNNTPGTYGLSTLATFRTPAISNNYQTNVYAGLSYIKSFKKSNQLSIGLTRNFGLTNIAYGHFRAPSSNSTFQTGFHSVSNSTGLRLHYSYNMEKKGGRENTQKVAEINEKRRKVFFIEALGSGGLFSANYDMRFMPDQNDGWGFRIGIGIGEDLPVDVYKEREYFGYYADRYLTFPLNINYIIGKRRSGFETGITLTPELTSRKLENDPQVKLLTFLNAGYRFQPIKKGLLIRTAWTPALINKSFSPLWAGVSLGYGFK